MVWLVATTFVISLGCSWQEDGDDANDGDVDSIDSQGDVNSDGTSDNGTTGQDTEPFQDTDDHQEVDTRPLPESCDESNYKVDIKKIDMLVVLDRSMSMEIDGIWDPMGQALTYVTSEYKDLINFGLMLFPGGGSSCDNDKPATVCVAPQSFYPDVSLESPSAATAIASVFDPSSGSHVTPCGGTPIASTLASAKDYLLGLPTQEKRYVLLATDGAPNCNPNLSSPGCICTNQQPDACNKEPLNCLDDIDTYAATEALQTAGIDTYVLGMGETVNARWSEQLGHIAQRGGTQSYYSVTDTAKLDDALETITNNVVRCDFDIAWDELDEDVATDKGLINFFCKESEFDPISRQNLVGYDENCTQGKGWAWVNDNTVRFCNDACNKLKRRKCSAVTVTFGCKEGTIVVK